MAINIIINDCSRPDGFSYSMKKENSITLSTQIISNPNQRSFLKWAGSKYSIRHAILSALPKGSRLIEPFVGAGSIFLNSPYDHYLLAETNPDLIDLFQFLQKEGTHFIEEARAYFQLKNNCAEQYALFRNDFNESLGKPKQKKKRALLFLYLNRHGFNGLCRYNSKGYFNVPFGRYTKPLFPEEAMLYFHQKSQHAVFQHADFRKTMNETQPGDVIYCDPPYVPLTTTAFFSKYTQGAFTADDQADLAILAEQTRQRGIPVIISNHDTPQTREYYKNARLIELNVHRHISCQATTRKKVSELIAIFD